MLSLDISLPLTLNHSQQLSLWKSENVPYLLNCPDLPCFLYWCWSSNYFCWAHWQVALSLSLSVFIILLKSPCDVTMHSAFCSRQSFRFSENWRTNVAYLLLWLFMLLCTLTSTLMKFVHFLHPWLDNILQKLSWCHSFSSIFKSQTVWILCE